MELQEFKNIWADYDRKLDKSLQLNLQILRKVNFDRISSKANTAILFKLAEMGILFFMMGYLFNFTIRYRGIPQFSIPAIVTGLFMMAGFISDIRQIIILVQLRTGFDEPVTLLQKKVEKLKLLIINYVKCSFISLVFYPLLMILAGKIFLNIDFFEPRLRAYLIGNVVVGLALAPLFIYLYVQLSRKNLRQVWVKNFLTGSGWNQAVAAEKFLKEIEEFEQE